MSHFYASIKGNRSERTCCGTKSSSISGHVRGWDIGAKVVVRHVDGKDVVEIYATTGSNNKKGSYDLIAEFSDVEKIKFYRKKKS